MSTAARIDELRKKFEENPRRYFAPLANEYRKAGDLSQAIALCREHLPKQPGHMSGYIVFGQALYEAGELGEARLVFEQALDLDPENLIALRHLGDIARAHGDAVTARRWYERVLDADPRNDDIAAQLATLGTGRTPISSPVIRPASGTPAVPSSAQPFARDIVTPPLGVTPVGLGAMPTPDAVMRAVDLDAFASLGAPPAEVHHASAPSEPLFVPSASPTPIDLDAIEDLGASIAAVPAPHVADVAPSPAAEADAFDFPDVGEIALAASAVPSAPSGEPVADATDDVDLAIEWATESEEPTTVGDDADAIEETFEEGLVAAEWPDTSEMVARRLTPRAPTPLSLTPQALTPISGEAVAETIAAFGAEPHEARIAQPELAESELAEPAHAGNDEPVIDAVAEPVVEAVAEPIAAQEQAVVDAPLPWLAVPDAPVVSDAERAAEQPGLEELAEVFAGDARAAGYLTPVMVAAVEDPEPSNDVQSFADLAAVVDDVSEEMMSDAQLAADAPDDVVLFGSAASAAPMVDAQTDMAQPDIAQHDMAQHAMSEPVEMATAEDPLVTEGALTEAAFTEAAFTEAAFDDAAFDDAAFDTGDAEALPLHEALIDEASSESPTFVTETMAELLVSQGFIGRAADVYEELVRRRPFDPVLSSRLTELRGMLAPASDASTALESTFAEQVDVPADSTDADLIAASFEDPTFVPMAMPTPAYGTPAFGTPAYVTPVLGTPALGSSAFETPEIVAPLFAAASASFTPEMSPAVSPLVTPPMPHHPTPYAQPALESSLGRRTAREWFAALASRRVPRRTPAHAAPAIAHASDGLSSLFGTDPVAHDDSAARALADAFAPISAQDLAGGSTLDFEYARATPAFGSSVAPASLGAPIGGMSRLTPVVPPRSMSPTPAGTFSPVSSTDVSPTGGGGNEGFAFDKFFPDPATRRGTPSAAMPSAAMPVAPDAPVTDDLAQFSAWLKGLGNT